MPALRNGTYFSKISSTFQVNPPNICGYLKECDGFIGCKQI